MKACGELTETDKKLFEITRKKQLLKTIATILSMREANIDKISLLFTRLLSIDVDQAVEFLKKQKPSFSDVLDIAKEWRLSVFVQELKDHICLGTEDKFLRKYPRPLVMEYERSLENEMFWNEEMYDQMNCAIDRRIGHRTIDTLLIYLKDPEITEDRFASLLRIYADILDQESFEETFRSLKVQKKLMENSDEQTKIELAKKLDAAIDQFEKKKTII